MPLPAAAATPSLFLSFAFDCELHHIAADELFRIEFLKAIIRQSNGGLRVLGDYVAVSKTA
jgi:hypothetical protein